MAAVVRMDRTRPHSTIHGERNASDRHAFVCFYQDGLPFGANGEVLADHPDIKENPKLVALLEQKQKKAEKIAKSAPGDAAADGSQDQSPEEAEEEVRLDLWARGEQQVAWQNVSNAIALRFHRRVKDKAAAIELLVGEGVVDVEHLPPAHRKLVA